MQHAQFPRPQRSLHDEMQAVERHRNGTATSLSATPRVHIACYVNPYNVDIMPSVTKETINKPERRNCWQFAPPTAKCKQNPPPAAGLLNLEQLCARHGLVDLRELRLLEAVLEGGLVLLVLVPLVVRVHR